MTDEENSWQSWRIYVLKEISRTQDSQKEILRKLDYIRDEVTALKVKSAIWGSVAGFVMAAAGFLAERLLK